MGWTCAGGAVTVHRGYAGGGVGVDYGGDGGVGHGVNDYGRMVCRSTVEEWCCGAQLRHEAKWLVLGLGYSGMKPREEAIVACAGGEGCEAGDACVARDCMA